MLGSSATPRFQKNLSRRYEDTSEWSQDFIDYLTRDKEYPGDLVNSTSCSWSLHSKRHLEATISKSTYEELGDIGSHPPYSPLSSFCHDSIQCDDVLLLEQISFKRLGTSNGYPWWCMQFHDHLNLHLFVHTILQHWKTLDENLWQRNKRQSYVEIQDTEWPYNITDGTNRFDSCVKFHT